MTNASKVGDLTIFYRVVEAVAKDVGNENEGILKDSFGREIYLIEGFVLKGIQSSPALGLENLDFIHHQLINYYCEFWEWITPQSAFASEKTILAIQGDPLSYKKLAEYVISKSNFKIDNSFSKKVIPESFNMEGEVCSVVFLKNSTVIARYDKTVTKIEINSRERFDLKKERNLIGAYASPLAISRRKCLLVTCFIEGFDQNIIRLWDLQSNSTPIENRKLGGENDIGGCNRVYAINFSSNDEVIACGGNSKLIKLWDVKEGGKRGELSWHTSDIKCIEASRLGREWSYHLGRV